MAVFRVQRTRDYTVMSNYHLRDQNLTLKAKGLLSMMLSLPDEWNYTTRGLAAICKEGRSGISSALKELEAGGYLVRERRRDEQGMLRDNIYVIYELPQRDLQQPEAENPVLDSPALANPTLVSPALENRPQISKEVISTEEINTDLNKRKREKGTLPSRHCYGAYRNVLLSEEELQTLESEFPQDYWQRIERLSEYMASTGKSYRSHLATIRSWARQDKQRSPAPKYSHDNYRCEEGDSL